VFDQRAEHCVEDGRFRFVGQATLNLQEGELTEVQLAHDVGHQV
jgi:hypothetical protein